MNRTVLFANLIAMVCVAIVLMLRHAAKRIYASQCKPRSRGPGTR